MRRGRETRRTARTLAEALLPGLEMLTVIEWHFRSVADAQHWYDTGSQPVVSTLTVFSTWAGEVLGGVWDDRLHLVDWATVRRARERQVDWDRVAVLIAAGVSWDEAAPHVDDPQAWLAWKSLGALRCPV